MAFTYNKSANRLLLITLRNFSREAFAQFAGVRGRRLETLWPKAIFFLHSFLERWPGAAAKSEKALSVSAHYWQRVLGRDSRLIVQCLVGMGVLETASEKDQAERKCRTYRLSETAACAPLRFVEVRSPAIARHVRARSRKAAAELDAMRGLVVGNLAAIEISADALAEAESRAHRSQLSQLASMLALRALITRDFWVSGKSGERLFHTVANCPRWLRSLLTVEHEPAAEADVSAMVPLLLLKLCPEGPERGRYKDAVSGGEFYERLRDALPADDAARLRQSWQSERAAFKEEFCATCLFSGKAPRDLPLFAAFRALFPELAAELGRLRRTKAGARELACRLWRWEAELFFERILPRVVAEMPGCRPVTLHDGILCQRRYVDAVARIIADEGEAFCGARPRVKIAG